MRNEPGVLVTALIVLACLFGGGGVAYGLANLVLQLAAILMLALNGQAVAKFVAGGPRGLALLSIATLALPLLQLIPLPASIWSTLPGRELLQESLKAAGAGDWHPLTVSTARTLVSFLGLIAPFALLALCLRDLSEATLRRAVLAFVGMGLAGVLLGAIQLLGGPGAARIYPETLNPEAMVGFFANRNSTAIFLVCCLLLLCTRPSSRLFSLEWIATASAATLLTVGVVLTQSRTGLVLLILPLCLGLLRGATALLARGRYPVGGKGGRIVLASLLVAATALLGLAASAGTVPESRFDMVLARFNKSEEQRPAIWEDARFSAERFWPVGAGMGTFDEVFQIDESLENISPRRAGRAHNDYIEIAIEAGAAGFALIALWTCWVLWAAWSGLGRQRRWYALAGTGILLAIALQSLLDYPLRNQTMLCMAAFAIVLLAAAGRAGEPKTSPEGARL
jgi:O-antigen ligase